MLNVPTVPVSRRAFLRGVGVLAAFVTTAPWPTLTAVGVVYVGSIPLTIRAYYRLKRAAEARRPEPAEQTAPVPLPTPAAIPLDETNAPSTEWRH